MDLGVLYLDEGRLDEAGKHFGRLAGFADVSFPALGLAGKAIVLAARNKPQSNRLLDKVFNPIGLAVAAREQEGAGRPP